MVTNKMVGRRWGEGQVGWGDGRLLGSWRLETAGWYGAKSAFADWGGAEKRGVVGRGGRVRASGDRRDCYFAFTTAGAEAPARTTTSFAGSTRRRRGAGSWAGVTAAIFFSRSAWWARVRPW